MKKTLYWIFIAILSGIILGYLTFDRYDDLNVRNVIKLDEGVYMIKYGTFYDEDEMFDNVKEVNRYIYINEGNKYDAYIAISKSYENISRILDIYKDKIKNLTIEKVNINNDEFIQNLDEYEKLLTAADTDDSLLIIENQILSCYEKLVLSNE